MPGCGGAVDDSDDRELPMREPSSAPPGPLGTGTGTGSAVVGDSEERPGVTDRQGPASGLTGHGDREQGGRAGGPRPYYGLLCQEQSWCRMDDCAVMGTDPGPGPLPGRPPGSGCPQSLPSDPHPGAGPLPAPVSGLHLGPPPGPAPGPCVGGAGMEVRDEATVEADATVVANNGVGLRIAGRARAWLRGCELLHNTVASLEMAGPGDWAELHLIHSTVIGHCTFARLLPPLLSTRARALTRRARARAACARAPNCTHVHPQRARQHGTRMPMRAERGPLAHAPQPAPLGGVVKCLACDVVNPRHPPSPPLVRLHEEDASPLPTLLLTSAESLT